ncbi:hypothetical protein QBC34DRAFT_415052 [Podospora aff. communis PSN243]|uniref:Secreted protein n=1 Tax=Podospora aff. communis PSN243 TaxID=3040156 RepID=A0AAV9G821_9PEZI|nr:hypothetical protein QBC34DRAFT_415052 [Podospora aff. communis PSN243]
MVGGVLVSFVVGVCRTQCVLVSRKSQCQISMMMAAMSTMTRMVMLMLVEQRGRLSDSMSWKGGRRAVLVL